MTEIEGPRNHTALGSQSSPTDIKKPFFSQEKKHVNLEERGSLMDCLQYVLLFLYSISQAHISIPAKSSSLGQQLSVGKDTPESKMQPEEEVSRNSEQLEWGGGKAAGEEPWLIEWVAMLPALSGHFSEPLSNQQPATPLQSLGKKLCILNPQ